MDAMAHPDDAEGTLPTAELWVVMSRAELGKRATESGRLEKQVKPEGQRDRVMPQVEPGDL